MANISIIGAGYVGLVTGACLAELGHNVICVETDQCRLSRLEQGELPIYEPGLAEMIGRHRLTGRISFISEYEKAIPESEIVFIAVNTPLGPGGEADTSCVFAAVHSILEHALPGLVIVTKSTVPVGTGDTIAWLIERSRPLGVEVVSNPEFLREGSAIQDFMRPDRIVVGASASNAANAVAGLYSNLDAPVIMCSRCSAELAKYAANALLATRISFMNEVSAVCEAVQANIEEVAQIVGADRRIGPDYLKAGLGWGGSCFPKDVRALMTTTALHGCRASILEATLDVNSRQRERAFERLCTAMETTENTTIGVLGLAFKPDTDDIRGAPALEIIMRLHKEGANIRAHDPAAMSNAQRILPDIRYCEDGYDVAAGSDALLLATEWSDYLNLNWYRMRSLMQGRVIFDGRNALDGNMLSMLGFTYLSFGCSPSARSGAQCLESESWTVSRLLSQEVES